MIKTIDNFLGDYQWLRSYLDKLEYKGQVNPVDGVEYPGINTQIPPGICADILTKLQIAVGKRISDCTLFMRMTLEGDDVPHQAHNDATMGRYGMILYLNRPRHCQGGTSFVNHIETGMYKNPINITQENTWLRDTNKYEAWEITKMIDMVSNRALIFDTKLMHRAEAPTGFGDCANNGRLVLSCFFEVFNG